MEMRALAWYFNLCIGPGGCSSFLLPKVRSMHINHHACCDTVTSVLQRSLLGIVVLLTFPVLAEATLPDFVGSLESRVQKLEDTIFTKKENGCS